MENTMSYIGKCKKCKNIMACVVDIPGMEKETAKDVAEFIKDGLEIGRETVEFVRANFNPCECNQKKQEQLGIFKG